MNTTGHQRVKSQQILYRRNGKRSDKSQQQKDFAQMISILYESKRKSFYCERMKQMKKNLNVCQGILSSIPK